MKVLNLRKRLTLVPLKFVPLTLVLVLTVVLSVACGRDNREEATAVPPTPEAAAAAPTPAPTEAAPATPEATAMPESIPAVALSDDPTTAVTDAMAAQVSGQPFRATTVIESGGTTTEMVSEIIPPDTIRVVIGGGNMEIILIEGVLWSKTSGAEWMQMGSPEMMQGIFDTVNGQIDGASLSNVQLVGSEPVFGEATDVYSFTSAHDEAEISSEVKLWISKVTGLPIRMESTSVAGGVTTTAVQTIEYDDSITITAPVP